MAESKNGGFAAAIGKGIYNLPWLHMLLMFLIYLFLNTDIFVESVLGRSPSLAVDGHPTGWGVVVSGMLLIILVLVADVAIDNGIFSADDKSESTESMKKSSKRRRKK